MTAHTEKRFDLEKTLSYLWLWSSLVTKHARLYLDMTDITANSIRGETMHRNFNALSVIYQTMHRRLVIVCKIDDL